MSKALLKLSKQNKKLYENYMKLNSEVLFKINISKISKGLAKILKIYGIVECSLRWLESHSPKRKQFKTYGDKQTNMKTTTRSSRFDFGAVIISSVDIQGFCRIFLLTEI